MSQKQREGVLITPQRRLTPEQIQLIDGISRELLEDPGVYCHNAAAAEIYRTAGAKVEDANGCVLVRLPSAIVDKALDTAPSKIVLGAREESNRLILDAHEPRVRFGSGSETNVWLEVEFEGTQPRFTRHPGSIRRLCDSAHLCDNLENLDFFIRNVNIQDEEVTEANKDVNKFLRQPEQHQQTCTRRADQSGRPRRRPTNGAYIIAGGQEAFHKNPILSFITCVIKSPLQMVDDTASTLIEISKRRVPVVISSCPMAGATAPFDEFGMVAQVNAEILAGMTLNQLVAPGAPVLYGASPVRTRLDNLHDMYGVAEFVHYNFDCAQMARFYGLPCYSTAGVGDTSVPGIQATAEKMLALQGVPAAGPQYVHYAFGLLERTNVFCPEQAVLDDAHIGMIKQTLRDTNVETGRREDVVSLVREVMGSSHKTYIYNLPLPSRDEVYVRYPLEDAEAGALAAAHQRFQDVLEAPRNQIPADVRRDLCSNIPGILPATLPELQEAIA